MPIVVQFLPGGVGVCIVVQPVVVYFQFRKDGSLWLVCMLTLSVCMVRRTLRGPLLSQAHSHRKVLLVPVVWCSSFNVCDLECGGHLWGEPEINFQFPCPVQLPPMPLPQTGQCIHNLFFWGHWILRQTHMWYLKFEPQCMYLTNTHSLMCIRLAYQIRDLYSFRRYGCLKL